MVERVKTPLDEAVTIFDEIKTVEFFPLLELDPANGLSALRDKQTKNGNATIEEVNGELRLRTAATATSSVILETNEKGRYQPGIQALAGIAVRRPTAPTGDGWRAGYYDDQNGYYIGEDSAGVYVERRSGGVDKGKVRPDDWRPGAPIGTIDFTGMTVVRFPHACYYQGPLIVEFMDVDEAGVARLKKVHRFTIPKGNSEPILQQSKLPLRAEIFAGEPNYDLFVGGRHYAVDGRYKPNRRETAERRLNASFGTTPEPLITFKKRQVYNELAKSGKISGLSVQSDTDALIEVHLNATLGTAASFNAITDIATAESAFFSYIGDNTLASAGQVVDRALVSGGSGNTTGLTPIRRAEFDIPDDAQVTLVARTLSGTGSISAVFSLAEEW